MYEPLGIIPRSLFQSVERFVLQLFQTNNLEIFEELRVSRFQILVAIRFILKLIFVPLILHVVTTNCIVRPTMKYLWNTEQESVFVNDALEQEALYQIQDFENELYFDHLVTSFRSEKPSWASDPICEIDYPDVIKSQVQTKTLLLAEQYNEQSIEALTNCFGDLLVIVTILLIFMLFPAEYIICQAFVMETFFSLNDAIKSTCFIFTTNLLVGFHSRRGWELFLEAMLQRLGFPPSDFFVHFFIGTFPVILSTVFKYWIFRYLNKVSPATVATYHCMIE